MSDTRDAGPGSDERASVLTLLVDEQMRSPVVDDREQVVDHGGGEDLREHAYAPCRHWLVLGLGPSPAALSHHVDFAHAGGDDLEVGATRDGVAARMGGEPYLVAGVPQRGGDAEHRRDMAGARRRGQQDPHDDP